MMLSPTWYVPGCTIWVKFLPSTSCGRSNVSENMLTSSTIVGDANASVMPTVTPLPVWDASSTP
jgi:hypothetical protein